MEGLSFAHIWNFSFFCKILSMLNGNKTKRIFTRTHYYAKYNNIHNKSHTENKIKIKNLRRSSELHWLINPSIKIQASILYKKMCFKSILNIEIIVHIIALLYTGYFQSMKTADNISCCTFFLVIYVKQNKPTRLSAGQSTKITLQKCTASTQIYPKLLKYNTLSCPLIIIILLYSM